MHEQNFEKQVQQKMEELSLTPSAPVWQKVEAQIRKKKDRRRLVFWLLPLLLAGGGAWWLLSGIGGSPAPAATNSITQQQPATPTTRPANVPAAPLPLDKTNEKDLSTATSNSIPTSSPTHLNTILAKKDRQPKQAGRTIVHPERTTSLQQNAFTETESPVTPNEVAVNKKEKVKKEVVTNKETTNAPQLSIDTATTRKAVANIKPVDASAAPMSATDIKPATPDSSAITDKAPLKKSKTSKWQWAAHIEAGITSEQASLFEMPSTRSMDVFYSPSQGASTGAGNFVTYTPSPIEDGPAFSGGVTVKRLLVNRVRLTAGLQYNFFSTRMTVGQEVEADTTVSYSNRALKVANHYRPNRPGSESNDYHNRYQFIQVPVGIEYQLLRKLPLQIHTGVALAQLINTNALLYDYNAHIYYQNSRVFNKTQWHLFANLTYSVWKGKTKMLNVGPYAQYSLTELQEDSRNNNRLFSAGLRTQLSF